MPVIVKKEKWETLKVYCSPTEKAELLVKAQHTRLTLSKYLLHTGMGYPVKSLLDHGKINELAKINGDLGRLGGLLKLWLTDDKKIARFEAKTVRTLLQRLGTTQAELRIMMREILA